jgi:hypothetical protein
MHPVSVKLPPEQRHWLEAQARLLDGLTRSDAIRLCVAACMLRGEPLIQQAQHDITSTGPADAN